MNERDDDTNSLLNRARQVLLDGDLDYARFLYLEALALDPQNNAARSDMHNLRKSNISNESQNSFCKVIKAAWLQCKILTKKLSGLHDEVIKLCEMLLDISPDSEFAIRNIMLAADNAGYSKLVIFISEKVMAIGYDLEDLIIIAKAYLAEKIFDQATKIAKEATNLDPQNEEIKEILWKASVEKHMNTNVQLVTAGENRFIPPKIDADKIFISSHREEAKEKSETQKPAVTP